MVMSSQSGGSDSGSQPRSYPKEAARIVYDRQAEARPTWPGFGRSIPSAGPRRLVRTGSVNIAYGALAVGAADKDPLGSCST